MNSTYTSVISWHHDNVYLDTEVPGFSTKEAAENFGRSDSQLSLLRVDGELCLQLVIGNKTIAIARECIKIKIDQRPQPRPLDLSNPDDFHLIMDSLEDKSSPYWITDEDLTDVSWTLEELEQQTEANCRFSSLSYGVTEVQKTYA